MRQEQFEQKKNFLGKNIKGSIFALLDTAFCFIMKIAEVMYMCVFDKYD